MTDRSYDIAPIRLSPRAGRRPPHAARSAAVERQLGLSAMLVAATLAVVVWNAWPVGQSAQAPVTATAPTAGVSQIFDTSKGVRRL